MELHNLMEEEVVHVVSRVMVEMKDVCDCDKCKLDVAAIALNNLPPKYVVTDKGYAYGKANNLNFQSNADIIAAVINAIKMVNDNPKHE